MADYVTVPIGGSEHHRQLLEQILNKLIELKGSGVTGESVMKQIAGDVKAAAETAITTYATANPLQTMEDAAVPLTAAVKTAIDEAFAAVAPASGTMSFDDILENARSDGIPIPA